MKKWATWVMIAALAVFVVAWGMMGIKISTNDFDVIAETYIGAACYVIIMVCVLIRAFSDRCPHCGKMRRSKGKYCPYCGKEI